MEAQWQPNFSPPGYDGPSFRRGKFLVASRNDGTHLHWSVFRLRADDSLEQLPGAEQIQPWNSAESVEFPRGWADGVLVDAKWE